MTDKIKVLDFFASLFGISCVDWAEDFSSDGYSDPSGLSPINEPFWACEQTVEISVINTNSINKRPGSIKLA